MMYGVPNTNQITEQAINPYACRRLWCAVLEEQCKLVFTTRQVARRHECAAAMHWFGSRDFAIVTELAGLDPAWIYGGVQRRIARIEGSA